MKNNKVFTVTPEILELFRNEKVSARTVKQLIPNYMDYQIKELKPADGKYLENVSTELYDFISGSHWLTVQEFLDKIQFVLDSSGLLIDNSQEIFHFNGKSLEDGYSCYNVYETSEELYIEREDVLLERLCKEIRESKKKEKEELKTIDITNEMLNKIANNQQLMKQLLDMQKN